MANKLRTVTAAIRDDAIPVQVDTVERLVEYINLLEEENARLHKQLSLADGDIPDDEVREAAAVIAEWLRKSFPDRGDREEYIKSYMDGKYVSEARKTKGAGHARAIALATRMALPQEIDNE